MRPARAKANSFASIAPARFLDKSFVECEKILGKPKLIDNMGAYYYKVPVPGLTRLVFYCKMTHTFNFDATGHEIFNFDYKRIGQVNYEFPKGQKTWQTACAKVGISSKGASVWPQEFSNGGPRFTVIDGLPGDYRAVWFPSSKSQKEDILRIEKDPHLPKGELARTGPSKIKFSH